MSQSYLATHIFPRNRSSEPRGWRCQRTCRHWFEIQVPFA